MGIQRMEAGGEQGGRGRDGWRKEGRGQQSAVQLAEHHLCLPSGSIRLPHFQSSMPRD